jgi:hypothetical protein
VKSQCHNEDLYRAGNVQETTKTKESCRQGSHPKSGRSGYLSFGSGIVHKRYLFALNGDISSTLHSTNSLLLLRGFCVKSFLSISRPVQKGQHKCNANVNLVRVARPRFGSFPSFSKPFLPRMMPSKSPIPVATRVPCAQTCKARFLPFPLY